MKFPLLFSILFSLSLVAGELSVRVLGSGGPDLTGRASASYLVSAGGKSLLVDCGGGAFQRFGEAGATLESLEGVLFTHFHIDHTADFPALMKAGVFSLRVRPLYVAGPTGNTLFPSTEGFLQGLFNQEHGAYPYMSDLIGFGSARTFPLVFDAFDHRPGKAPVHEIPVKGFKVTAMAVTHGPVPALAYRVEAEGKSVVFSGDTSAVTPNLARLAKGADLLVAHHAVPQDAGEIARALHMTPERIGEVAEEAGVKKVLLSHRMGRTLGREAESEGWIRKHYKGPLLWAEDLMEVAP